MAVADDAGEAGTRRRRRRLARERAAREAQVQEARERRSRWRWVLLVGGAVLVGYYTLVFAGLSRQDAGVVALSGLADDRAEASVERLTLQVEAIELDTSSGSFDIRLRPVPRGRFAEPGRGGLATPVQLNLVSPGEPPISFDFPAHQLVDPVGASVEASAVSRSFPFDRPQIDFRLEALSGNRPVPLDLEMVDETEGWQLTGSVVRDDGGLDVDLDAGREMLSVSFALFYIAGIVVIALITVAVIGGAIARAQVGFEQVIWLGAMLVAIPAVRNEMPGVPAVGTAVDLFVYLPSVVIVALALLAAIVVLVINEASAASSARPEPSTTPVAPATPATATADGD